MFCQKIAFYASVLQQFKIFAKLADIKGKPFFVLVFILLAFMPFCLGKGLVKLVGFGLKSLN